MQSLMMCHSSNFCAGAVVDAGSTTIMPTAQTVVGIVHMPVVHTVMAMDVIWFARRHRSTRSMARESGILCQTGMATQALTALLVPAGREAITVRVLVALLWLARGKVVRALIIAELKLMTCRICHECRHDNSPWHDSNPPRCQNPNCPNRHYQCIHCFVRKR
ncbi:hypothetical protein K431DRAFT_99944 [Polychaeton citri CBS 116435]|uniref:Uncharacterized protein n=1 Tax=Polychaeton citri CBS 116435 TaxID=1314669 RepID=A0A9P4QI37_9PEZI|nr:hypothetical protein K431DRAFT_99944 [Polychaeton citri CBS 116435]